MYMPGIQERIQELNKRIDDYRDWNNAFNNHFFNKKNEDEEVFLYITEEKINEIGKENNLGSLKDFLSTVLLHNDERAEFYDALCKRYIGSVNNTALKRDRSIFRFATCLINNNLYEYIPCAFLNYLVLAIYIVSMAQTNDISALGRHLKRELKQMMKEENGDYHCLEALFEELHSIHPSFLNYALTGQRYVGLLKYQLVLSDRQIESLKKSLYRNRFEFDDDSSYTEKVFKIFDYVDDEIKDLLHTSLNSIPHQKRIDDIISHFDPEEYEADENVESRRIVGTFVHALYFNPDPELEEECCRLVLLTDVCSLPIQCNDFEICPELYDRIGGYNPNHVKVNKSDQIKLEDYKLSSDKVLIRPLKNDGIVFFKKYSDSYYIETRNQCTGETYVAVSNRKLRTWNGWIEKHGSENPEEIPSDIILPVLGVGWHLFVCSSGFDAPYYKDTLEIDEKGKVQINKRQILQKGGIIPNNKKNVYLANALPYFEFPVKIDRDKLKVSINIDNKNVAEGESYHLFVKDENKLIIDIKDNAFVSGYSHEFDLLIEYNSDLFTGCCVSSFYICGQDVKYPEKLFKYDKWGQVVDEGSEMDELICGNIVAGAEHCYLRGVAANLGNLGQVDKNDLSSFYFINLLAACCFMNEGRPITTQILKKCIRYAATRTNIDYLSDGCFVSRLRNLLVNSGYICPSYGKQTLYQAIPPTFVKIPAPVNVEKKQGATYWYMLCGCYTQHFMADLISYCENEERNLTIRQKSQSGKSASSAYSLLPPVLLLDNNFDPEDFNNKTGNHCICNNGDLSMEILSKLPSIIDYSGTLKRFDGIMNISLLDDDGNNFPRIRTSIAEGYKRTKWIEDAEGYKYSPIRDFAWMELYCKYKQNAPMLLYSTTGEICIPDNIHLPYLLQRVMFLMNVGQPQYKKVFICNNEFTHDEFYSPMKIYNIGTNTDRLCKIISLLTGQNCTEDNKQILKVQSHLKYSIQLWKRKEKFSKKDKFILTLKYIGKKDYEAIATFDSTYISRDGKHQKVIGTPNSIFSTLITHPYGTWDMLGINFVDNKFLEELPSVEDYDIEEIEIK